MDDIPSGNDKTGVSEEPAAPRVQGPPPGDVPDGRNATDRLTAAARLDPEKTIVASAPLLSHSEPAAASETSHRHTDATIVGSRPATDNGATIFARGAFTPEPSLRRSPPPGTAVAAPMIQLEIGSVLGNRYEILELLGEGGMGA